MATGTEHPKIDLLKLITETQNPASEAIDTLSTFEILKVINAEDQKVALAVEKELNHITAAVDVIAEKYQKGGRLIYVGAGTSGRLGILDASECPPTFGTDPNQIIGLIAGGYPAILKAVENAEDNQVQAIEDLKNIQLNHQDVLVGIAASGRTPYVLSAMQYARSQGAYVISLSCNPASEMIQNADLSITPIVGAEVVTGSSRMKAGTAQKLVLNMLTTASMIKSGKVFGNLMVDVEATNAKLIQRQTNIVMQATECDRQTAERALNACERHCKTAIYMILTGESVENAKVTLSRNKGFIRNALKDHAEK